MTPYTMSKREHLKWHIERHLNIIQQSQFELAILRLRLAELKRDELRKQENREQIDNNDGIVIA